MSDALNNLAQAIKDASGSVIDLTEAFLAAGLNDAAIIVPAGLDTALAKAFGTPDGNGLDIKVEAVNVGPVNADAFTVTKAGLTLLGQALDAAATLHFSLVTDHGRRILTLQSETAAAGWQWTWLGSAAQRPPYTYLPVQDVTLTFATTGDTAAAIQQFRGTIAPPGMFRSVVSVIENLGFPSVSLPLTGPMDFSEVDGKVVRLPVATLSAPIPLIGGAALKLGYLTVGGPSFGFTISESFNHVINDEGEPGAEQQTLLFFAVALALAPQNAAPVDYSLIATVDPAFDDGTFTFSLLPDADSPALFTPATAIALVNDSGSFFAGTPAPLQQFLGGIGLRGLTLEGLYKPRAALTSVRVTIGADPAAISREHPLTLLSDPSNDKVYFEITDFELDWRASFGIRTTFDYLISTEFSLLPQIFKGSAPDTDGLFSVEINSASQIFARFDGQASSRDLLLVIAGIDTGDVFNVKISDVKLAIDLAQKRYALNAGLEVDIGIGLAGSGPIFSLSAGQLSLAAATPRTKDGATGGSTAYSGAFSGLVNVGPVYALASITYDNPVVNGGAGDPVWRLQASLARSIDMAEIIGQYFDPGGTFALPDFFDADLTITAMGLNATIPTAKTARLSYVLSASFAWNLRLGSLAISSPKTDLLIAYDGMKPSGQQYSGRISTVTEFSFLQSDVEVAFAFKKDALNAWDNTLAITWEGLTATYASKADTLTFTLKNWSLGSLIERLVQSLGDPYFTLPSPWDLLNKIPLDGLSVTLHLAAKSNEPKITASYTLPSPIDLGFIKIHGLDFARAPVGGRDKITLSIDATIPGPLQSVIDGGSPAEQMAWNNLLGKNSGPVGSPKGQSVDDLPSVPGKGNDYFNMPVLVLGQRVGIAGHSSFNSTKEVIAALSGTATPSTTGKDNPVSPRAGSGSAKGTPYYEAKNNWLIATHLQLLKSGKDWTVDLMLVFADPNLYGLRLALAGDKAKALGKLEIDILYKKITDDIGVYEIEFTFPDSIRNLNFGTVSIVLPQLGLKIYTNGDFLVDVGFPYNMDFSRSFSVSTIVFAGPIPIPLTGAGGFYFGKLSAATATQVPVTNKGTFSPVIVFGLGVQLGLGYNFMKGPLKAGFALTVFGIVEGVIATWNPYQITQGGDHRAVQDNYYFKISGTVGIIGLLYGEVNFAIISASLQIKLTLSITLTYESYRPIPIMVRATVDVSLKVKIDLGLFSISISLAFHADVSTRFVIEAGNTTAPWDPSVNLTTPALPPPLPSTTLARIGYQVAALRAAPRPVQRAASKPKLALMAAPQFTVMADQAETDAAKTRGAFVFLLAIDAPDPTATSPATGTSLETLLQDLLPWVVDAFKGVGQDTVNLSSLAATAVTDAELTAWIESLSNLSAPPISFTDYLGFLSSFDVDIVVPATAGDAKKFAASSALFPVFDGLSIAAGTAAGPLSKVDFARYVTANETYRSNVAALFEKLTAKVGEKKGGQPHAAVADGNEISMAAFVFVDAFNLLARQLLQSGLTALRDFHYPLANGNALGQILSNVNTNGNSVTVAALVQANLGTALATEIPLTLPPMARVVQAGATLDTLSATLSPAAGATAAAWITQNPTVMSLVPGQPVTVAGKTVTTGPGATFESLAALLGMSLAELAADPDIGTTPGILLPGAILSITDLVHTTGAGATLGGIGDHYAFDATALFADTLAVNLAQDPLFDTGGAGAVPVPGLTALGLADMWASIASADQVAQIAGMLTRFLVYGLRLPSGVEVGGPSLSGDFLYPAQQDSYGLYQLLGQQIPVPDWTSGASLTMTLARAAAVGTQSLDFITFNGAAGTSGPAQDLSQAYGRMAELVRYARDGLFVPEPGFEVQESSARTPKDFSVRSNSSWAAADAATVQRLCGAPTGSQADPVIWSLPDALTRSLAQRQFRLSERFSGPTEATRRALQRQMFGFMPVLLPMLSATDPATGGTTRAPVAHMCWATRVDLAIRKLPAPRQPAGRDGLAGVTYELVGASPDDALLLERCLTAMDALGDTLVSDLFLMYGDSSTGTPRLATPAASDYVAFLTQTNMSTETHPPASLRSASRADAPGPVRGIANTANDAVRLLWELSTVRSGGYFLTWRNLVSSTGLPDGIFDDNGRATLTLLLTYDPASLQGHLTNFINAFVTTDLTPQHGTQVSTTGVSSTAADPPLLPSDSLDTLAAVFGVGVGPIAEANADLVLPAGLELPVDGVIHLVTRAEAFDGTQPLPPATILAAIAAGYSANAVAPITGQDIARLNPGAAVGEGAALFIPTLVYRTAAKDKLSGIASTFGIPLDRLAVSAAGVAGLFGAQPITIDSLTYDVQGGTGDGNIGLEITRAAYPAPSDPPDADYARNYLYSLYGVISAGLRPNAGFSANDAALPFGPQDHSGTDAATMRDAARRRMALRAMGTTDRLIFRQSLNVIANAQTNAAPVAPWGPQTNPYAGVGSLAQLALEWRDIFGNTTVTPWRVEPEHYPYLKNGQPLPVLYTDRLTGLGNWPNLHASHYYDGAAGSPLLHIVLAFNTGSYVPAGMSRLATNGVPDWQQRAAQDLLVYRRIWWQLHQDYSGLNLPWCKGRAVTATWRNSLTGGTPLPLTDAEWTRLGTLLEQIILYLDARSSGAGGTPPQAKDIVQPFDLAKLPAANIIPLGLTLTLERPALLVAPEVASLSNGHAVTSLILPLADDGANTGASGYSRFAAMFETAFARTGDWNMRVGAGLARPDESVNGRSQALFALRLRDPANGTAPGIRYTIGAQPGFYAPKPLARTLSSGSFEVDTVFDPDNPKTPITGRKTVTLTGVDANAMFQTCLTAIDSFLSPTYATPAFLLEATGDNDPLATGPLGIILAAKQLLADSIAQTCIPVLSTSPGNASVLTHAREKLRQALLNELAPAYGISAVIGFDVLDTGGAPSGPAGPATFYGQPGPATPNATNDNYAFSTGRFALGPQQPGPVNPGLAFLFNTKNQAAQSYVGLDLALQLTHLEHDRRHVPGISGYTQSSWIALVSGPIKQPLAGGARVDIPVVLRALPEPPTMRSQAADPTFATPSTPGELVAWNFTFDYLYRRAAQDTAQLTVGFNRSVDKQADSMGADNALMTRLVEFTTLYPQIEALLDTVLARISAEDATDPNTDNHVRAETAVTALATVTHKLAEAFDAWVRPRKEVTAPDAAPVPAVVCSFELILSGDSHAADPGRSPAQSEILNLTLNDIPAHLDSETGQVSAIDVKTGQILVLPLPRIDIPGYTARMVAPYAPAAIAAYGYTLTGSDPAEVLTYADASDLPARRICFDALNLFVYQDARASIRVERNKYLTPEEETGAVTTNAEFLFATPTVQFADPTIPELRFADFSLSGLVPEKASTAGYLDAFFAAAAAGGQGAPIEVAMEARYSYVLADSSALPRTVLPVAFLLPTPCAAEGDVAPAAVTDLAVFVDAWRAETGVTETGAAQIGFGLKVFSGTANGVTASQQPILSISDVSLDATKVPLA